MGAYHKINALFKREMDGKRKGKLILGDWSLPEFEYLAKNEWEFTEKVDGTNIRVEFDNNSIDFAGRTDRSTIPVPLMEHLISTFGEDTAYKFDANMSNSAVVTLYGEGYGPKIQGGGKYRDDTSFVLFDVHVSNLNGDFWLDRDNVNDVARKLGIDSVPVIGSGTLWDAIDIVSSGLTWDKNGKMTNWGGNGIKGLKSQWGNFNAEGIVARPIVPMFDRHGNRIITKIKGADFR